ncbi:MAG: hypothetical protein V1779_03870 [bacterium]
MFPLKPLYKFLIGLLIILSLVIVYLIFKFDYYEDKVINKINQYNKTVEIYYSRIEKLDSITALKYSKYNFFYWTKQKEIPEEYGTDYKSFLTWMSNRINKMNQVIMEISTLNLKKQKTDTLSDEFFELQKETMALDSNQKVNKELLYSPDELNEIYEEANEEKNELYDKKFKK